MANDKQRFVKPVDRAAFEAWARWYALPLSRVVSDERYESLETEAAHKAWQARAELDRQGRGEPVAFSYELATTFDAAGMYSGWSPRLSFSMPNVPDGGIRNLTWLFTAPQPAEPTVKESLTVAEPVKVPRDTPGFDAKALETAQEIALMWGNDRSQFVARIQVAVIDAMKWACSAAPVAAQPSVPAGGVVTQGRWTCLLCGSGREGYHGTLDDRITPCPNRAAAHTPRADGQTAMPEPVSILGGIFRSNEGRDKNQPGYQYTEGWNAAIRYAMDVLRANTPPTDKQEK